MSKNICSILLFPLLATGLLGLTACGGGSSNGTAASATAGQMQLAVADAPADGAEHVVVVFTAIELTGNGGNSVTITLPSPKSIDLMTDSGTASAVLFNQPIPAGAYGQIRLMIAADGSGNNSYIQLSDGTIHGLMVPSGSQTGLKLVSGFTVPGSGVVDYTIDFDLRQAITCPPGQSACILKPAERLVDDTSVGNIQGQIESTLPSGCSPGVYLYSGIVTRPEDMNSTAVATDTNQPLASKIPVATTSPPYYFQFTFLAPGSYTVAFTCQASQDNPDQADQSVTLTPVGTATVTAGQTQTVDITLGGVQGQVTLPTSGCAVPGPGVYLYAGTVSAPEDWNSLAPSGDSNQPLTSVVFAASAGAPYEYQFMALPPGPYTVAFTCQATQDNRAQADSGVMFSIVKPASVVADTVTTVNIP